MFIHSLRQELVYLIANNAYTENCGNEKLKTLTCSNAYPNRRGGFCAIP